MMQNQDSGQFKVSYGAPLGFPGGANGKEPCRRRKRCRFGP